MVQHDIRGHAKASTAPVTRKGKVHVRWQRIRQPVQSERGLVRHYAGPLGPQPNRDQLLVLARGEVHEPVDATKHANDAPDTDVVHEQLRRVAGLSGLLGREVPRLPCGDLIEAVPIRVGWK